MLSGRTLGATVSAVGFRHVSEQHQEFVAHYVLPDRLGAHHELVPHVPADLPKQVRFDPQPPQVLPQVENRPTGGRYGF